MLRSPLSGFRKLFKAVQEAIADLYAIGGASPKLVFDFASDYYRTSGSDATFADSITHARASNATMVDSDGLLKWAPHNLLRYSEEFDNAAWAKAASGTGSSPVVTANAATAPDGSFTADRIQFDQGAGTSVSDFSLILQNPVFPSAFYTNKIWLKSNTGSNQVVLAYNTGNGVGIEWTLTPEWQLFTLAESSYSNSDYRAGDPDFAFGLRGGAGTGFPTGTNTPQSADILAWGAHLYRSDLGGMVNNPDRGDSYVPTTSSARYLPRRGHHVYNGSAWVNEGLLVESEQRINVAYYSNDISETTGWNAFYTLTAPATGITGIDGVSGSPFKLIATDNSQGHFTQNKNFVTSGNDYVLSAILKDAGDGVYAGFSGMGIGGAQEVPVFNLVNGTVDVGATTTSVKEAGIYPWNDNGWYLCWARVTAGSSGGIALTINDTATDNTTAGYTWTGDNTSGYYVAYVGVEQTSGMPSSPIPTSGSTVTRAADSLTVPSANLPWPEPVVIGDEQFDASAASESTGVAQDGTNNDWTMTAAAANSSAIAYDAGFTANAGKVYLIQFEVYDYIFGSVASRIQGANGPTRSANGVYTEVRTAIATGDFIGIAALTTSTLKIRNISVKEINPLSVSIQMDGEMTYADTGASTEVQQWRWDAGADEMFVQVRGDAGTGQQEFRQVVSGVVDNLVSSGSYYSPGINVPFNIASRHGSTFLNGAVDGVALTANTTPTALPDLSATDLNLAYDYMGTIKTFRMWADEGIEEATTPAIPALAIQTRDGSYLLDRSGNYIETRV